MCIRDRGGFGFDLAVKGFELNTTFSYSLGGYAYDGVYATLMSNVIFILPIISLIVLSLNICSFAMITGFSTSEPDEKKQQDFLSVNAISDVYKRQR